MLLSSYTSLFRVLKPDSLCLSFYRWPYADILLNSWRSAGFRPVSVCAFIKRRIGLGYFTRAQDELACLLAKGRPRKPQRAPSDVIEWECSGESFHPNQKPVGALARLIAAYADENTFVIDPFWGSGTTLLAARNCGVSAVGIEIEERFCEVAALLLSQQVLGFERRAPILNPYAE